MPQNAFLRRLRGDQQRRRQQRRPIPRRRTGRRENKSLEGRAIRAGDGQLLPWPRSITCSTITATPARPSRTPSSSCATTAKGTTRTDQYREVESDFALGFIYARPQLSAPRTTRRRPRKRLSVPFNFAPTSRRWRIRSMNQRSNVLLVVDFGYGPEKVKNYDGALVGFGPTPREAGPIPAPMVIVDGSPMPLRGVRPPSDRPARTGAGPALGEHRYHPNRQDRAGHRA